MHNASAAWQGHTHGKHGQGTMPLGLAEHLPMQLKAAYRFGRQITRLVPVACSGWQHHCLFDIHDLGNVDGKCYAPENHGYESASAGIPAEVGCARMQSEFARYRHMLQSWYVVPMFS